MSSTNDQLARLGRANDQLAHSGRASYRAERQMQSWPAWAVRHTGEQMQQKANDNQAAYGELAPRMSRV